MEDGGLAGTEEVLGPAVMGRRGEAAVQVHALSGADAVHLAAAQASGSDLLLSAHRSLCAAAQRCGMATVELNDPA